MTKGDFLIEMGFERCSYDFKAKIIKAKSRFGGKTSESAFSIFKFSDKFIRRMAVSFFFYLLFLF